MTDAARQATLFLRDQGAPSQKCDLGPASLVFIYPPGPYMGRRYALEGAQLVVGREGTNDLAIEADSVSRRHARLVREAEGWVVEDLGSTNGTFVNDLAVRRRSLRDGDLIRFGAAVAKFLSGDNVEASYHEEIYRLTITDALTGAHNKRYLNDFVERELAAAIRYALALSLVMFDLDHFKRVNDQHGHLAGDAVLREVGRRIRPRMRREDLFARYGGEEFACVLVKTPGHGAACFAESLRQMIEAEAVRHGETSIPVTVSLGVAELWPQVTPSELIALADARLYEAKRQGRNRVIAS